MVNSNVANFLWVGNSLSLYETKCIESFICNGFEVNIYSYGILEVPNGAKLLDGRTIIPEEELYSYTQAGKKGNLAAFSDAFRYELTRAKAGWWFDTDIFCLKSVQAWQDLANNKKSTAVLGWESNTLINGAVIYSDNIQFDMKVQEYLKEIGKDFIWGAIGPRLITKAINELGLEKDILDRNYFYPIHFNDLEKMLNPAEVEYCRDSTADSYCVHLWNEFFNIYKIPKNVPPPKNSYLYKLFSQHSELDPAVALPYETCKVLCERTLLPELKLYKENMENKLPIKIYRALRHYIK